MIIKYINSAGKELILNSLELRIQEANFHAYSWRYNGKEKNRGISVSEFRKEEAKYKIKLCAYGTIEKRKELFNKFLETTEYDIERNTPGKLWFDDWYLECFVIESETSPNKNYYTERNIIIMGPSNEWVKTTTKKFLAKGNMQTRSNASNSDYPKDYLYDYDSKISKENIINEGYSEEDFRMTIYGPVIDPIVTIGKNVYQVYTEIKENEYLVIDTLESVVEQYDNVGNKTIKYNSRNKNYKLYEKIPIGTSDVLWTGDFGFDILTYEKRSEPKWNLS